MNEQTEELNLSDGQRFASHLLAGGIVLVVGVLLLLCGLNVLGETFTLKNTALFLALGGTGLILFGTALIQKNALSMWMSACFLCPAAVTAAVNLSEVGYAQLYPVYIAAPGIASLAAMAISREFRFHFKIALFFLALAGIFALASSSLIGYVVLLPVLIVILGAVMIVESIRRTKHKGENDA